MITALTIWFVLCTICGLILLFAVGGDADGAGLLNVLSAMIVWIFSFYLLLGYWLNWESTPVVIEKIQNNLPGAVNEGSAVPPLFFIVLCFLFPPLGIAVIFIISGFLTFWLSPILFLPIFTYGIVLAICKIIAILTHIYPTRIR